MSNLDVLQIASFILAFAAGSLILFTLYTLLFRKRSKRSTTRTSPITRTAPLQTPRKQFTLQTKFRCTALTLYLLALVVRSIQFVSETCHSQETNISHISLQYLTHVYSLFLSLSLSLLSLLRSYLNGKLSCHDLTGI